MTGSTNNRRFAEQTYPDNRASFVDGDCEVSDVDDNEAAEDHSNFDVNSYVRLPPFFCRSTMNVFEEMSMQFECSNAASHRGHWNVVKRRGRRRTS